uniref:Somatostatin receptor type 5-like n=1 Tax=Phallusia mammillata TaxID=59560 RepID=A0A6F9DUD0_9ASCI|nr:somatostatin receptor type 5-like [Phallusia mammillata]
MNCNAPNITGNATEEHGLSTELVVRTIILPTIFTLVCVVGLIGNGLVLYVMQFKVARRSITDIFVTNLAVADFIFLSMLPFWTTELALNNRWIFGYVLCKLTSASTLFHMYASVFFLTAMAVDRLLAVVFANTCRALRSRSTALIGSIAVWIISVGLSIVPAVFRGLNETETGKYHCTWTFNETMPERKPFFIFHFVSRSVIGFTLPLLVIAACYTSIAVFLKTRKTGGKLTGKLQERVTVLVLVVIVVFIVCWLPNQVSNIVYVLQALKLMAEPDCPSLLHYYIHMFSTCLAWGHSCVNPILYVIMRRDLKTKIVDTLKEAGAKCGLVTRAEELFAKAKSKRENLNNLHAAPNVVIVSATKGDSFEEVHCDIDGLLVTRSTNLTSKNCESPSMELNQRVETKAFLTPPQPNKTLKPTHQNSTL